MLRRFLPALSLLALSLLALAGCSTGPASEAPIGNAADVSTVPSPPEPRWFTGKLVVEPATGSQDCLLLTTGSGTYASRPVDPGLVPVAWESDLGFDATRSGIARGARLVAPYADEHTSVRGAVVAPTDGVCSTHRTLAFSKVSRGVESGARRTGPTTPPSDPVTAAAEPDAGAVSEVPNGFPGTELVWKSGRITVVPGNQGEGHCVVLDTAEGGYVLGSSTDDYDVVTTETAGNGVDERRTGVHVHGRNSLGMAASYGQRATLRGSVGPGTDVTCSAYPMFAIVDVRRT